MAKIRNFIITIVTAILTYWIQFGLNKLGIIKKENISVDFIFYIVIFLIIYILLENLSKIIRMIKNRQNKQNKQVD
nr:hypothetical protein [uncultured Tyzzerella sp.]